MKSEKKTLNQYLVDETVALGMSLVASHAELPAIFWKVETQPSFAPGMYRFRVFTSAGAVDVSVTDEWIRKKTQEYAVGKHPVSA